MGPSFCDHLAYYLKKHFFFTNDLLARLILNFDLPIIDE